MTSLRETNIPKENLIRISPTRVVTQVSRSSKYRPFRSLLLLGLLVLVSLLVLFTLSQMAIVHHHMIGQIGPRHAPVKPRKDRPDMVMDRAIKRALRGSFNHFNQFKIEPLLKRNAPTVEVNFAMEMNKRKFTRISYLIERSSFPSQVQNPLESRLLLLPPAVQQDPVPASSDLGPLHIANQDTMNNKNLSDYQLLNKQLINDNKINNNHSFKNKLKDAQTRKLFNTVDCVMLANSEECRINNANVDNNNNNNNFNNNSYNNDRNYTYNSESKQIENDVLYIMEENDKFSQKKNKMLKIENESDIKEKSRMEFTPTSNHSDIKDCPLVPPNLLGRLELNMERLEEQTVEDVMETLHWVQSGGKWSPLQDSDSPCHPRHKVAIIIPYRDRLHHLIILLAWLHPILRRQQLDYVVYVAEQYGNSTFNKGTVMNAGFVEAWNKGRAEGFVFHDVDLLPEDDRIMYSPPPSPRHLSVGVDTLQYKLPYELLVGGVFSVRGEHFLKLNGYSNMYWGWGGEDDDMGYRIKQAGFSILRPPCPVARYTMLRHMKRRPLAWKVRGKLVKTSGRRYRLDGLNTLKYSLVSSHNHPLFTHLLIDVGKPPENLTKLDTPHSHK